MKKSLQNFRAQLIETVLTFLWQQWSGVGVMASGNQPERPRIIDPEPMLLITLECARQDSRIFDEVMDWLRANGRSINVTRLTTLLKEDQCCDPKIVGAMAATLAQGDRTPKWETLARQCRPQGKLELESLFQKNGKPLFHKALEPDKTFADYGFLREPLVLRGKSSFVPTWTSCNFIFRARAFFGVNIRADVFAFLIMAGAAHPSRLARDLGYSQRRVQDALVEMTAADMIFKVRADGNRKEYFVDSAKAAQAFFCITEKQSTWFKWRAFARGISKLWRCALSIREHGLTPYILESEMKKVADEAKDDLLAVGISWPAGGGIEDFCNNLKQSLSECSVTETTSLARRPQRVRRD